MLKGACSRPLRLYCDCGTRIDGFGATLEQAEPRGSICSMTYVSRAALDSERHGTPLFGVEAGRIAQSIKRVRGYQ